MKFNCGAIHDGPLLLAGVSHDCSWRFVRARSRSSKEARATILR